MADSSMLAVADLAAYCIELVDDLVVEQYRVRSGQCAAVYLRCCILAIMIH